MKIAGCYGKSYTDVSNVFKRKPMVIGQDRPHIEAYEDIAPIQKAKEIYKLKAALTMLKEWRAAADEFGAMCGAQEYGEQVINMGITPELFSYAQKHRASLGLINDYASVRNALAGNPRDNRSPQQRNIDDMNEQIMYANEYARMEEEYPEDDYIGPVPLRRSIEEDEEDEDEEGEVPQVKVKEHIETIPTEILSNIIDFSEQQDDLDDKPDELDKADTSLIPDEEIARLMAGEISIEELMKMFASDKTLADALSSDQVERIKEADPNLAESIGLSIEMFHKDEEEIARIGTGTSSIEESIELAYEMFGIEIEVLPPDDDDYQINLVRPIDLSDEPGVIIDLTSPLLDSPDDTDESEALHAIMSDESHLLPSGLKTDDDETQDEGLKGTEVVVYEEGKE